MVKLHSLVLALKIFAFYIESVRHLPQLGRLLNCRPPDGHLVELHPLLSIPNYSDV